MGRKTVGSAREREGEQAGRLIVVVAHRLMALLLGTGPGRMMWLR